MAPTADYVDLYTPTPANPYWHTVTRAIEGGWGISSDPVRDARNGLTDGRCLLTQEDAIAIVRGSNPTATIVVRGDATRATGYVCPELARSVADGVPIKTEKRASRDGIAARLIETRSGDVAYQMFICTPEATDAEAIALGVELGFRGVVARNSSTWFQCEREDVVSRHCESCDRSVDIFDEPEALAIGGDSAPDSYFCTDTRACEARRS